VTNLDTVARTFSIGDTSIAYTLSTPAPSSWANGSLVQVQLSTAHIDGQAWTATAISLHGSGLDALAVPDNADAVLRGTVTRLNSATSLVVDGVTVNASQAQFSGSPVVGSLVDISGTFVAGAVVARQVTVRNATGASSIGQEGFDFIGTAGNIDTTHQTFALQGLGFHYAQSTFVLVGGVWEATEIRSAL
jgi:hypothetical protein